MNKAFQLLKCPIEGDLLTVSERSLKCPAGHSFDIAREGYVNLLPVQNKRSKDPGDSKEMIAARRRLLGSGVYEPIALVTSKAVLSALDTQAEDISCLDAGCGEGYYLRHLQQLATGRQFNFIGVDISKWAVQAAAKQDPCSVWVVGSNAKLPIADGAVDIILCMFGFPVYEEFARTLKPRGRLIMIEPGPDHLQELRAIIYPELKSKREPSELAPQGFELVCEQAKSFQVSLKDKSMIADLLVMTPHLYRASAQGKQAAAALEELDITIDIQVKTLAKI